MARVTSRLNDIVTSTVGFIGNKVYNNKHKDGSRRLKLEVPFLISENEENTISKHITEEFGDLLERVEIKVKKQLYYPEKNIPKQQILVYLKS